MTMIVTAESNIRAKLEKRLEQGIKELNLEVSTYQQSQLIDYIELFDKWNRAYNLSAIRDVVEMVTRHLLDSLAVAPHLQAYFETINGRSIDGQSSDERDKKNCATQFIDVGTGGGLPGIPLAILFPKQSFTLLDSNGKKTRFLFQVKTELKLDNVTVENCRVEQFTPSQLFDGVISRAFASIEDMTRGCAHLLRTGGYFWAMKGIYPQDELAAVQKNYTVAGSHRLQVPECDGERHLLLIKPVTQ